MAYGWTFRKDPLKLEKILLAIHNSVGYNRLWWNEDPQKKSFIEPAKSCPLWLKTLRKNIGFLVQKYRIPI